MFFGESLWLWGVRVLFTNQIAGNERNVIIGSGLNAIKWREQGRKVGHKDLMRYLRNVSIFSSITNSQLHDPSFRSDMSFSQRPRVFLALSRHRNSSASRLEDVQQIEIPDSGSSEQVLKRTYCASCYEAVQPVLLALHSPTFYRNCKTAISESYFALETRVIKSLFHSRFAKTVPISPRQKVLARASTLSTPIKYPIFRYNHHYSGIIKRSWNPHLMTFR